MSVRLIRTLLALLLTITGTSTAASAQDAPPTGWFNTAELTAIWTAGNSPASTFGAKNELRRVWAAATFKLQAGGLRTEATRLSRTASGSATNFSINETSTSTVTAENYFLRGRYDRSLPSSAFLFGGAGWSRNTFAGIQNRYSFVTGAGRAWVDRDGARFKTDLGLTYTIQDDVVNDPDESDGFIGFRFTTEGLKQLTSTTIYSSTLIVDQNLNQRSDLRGDFINAVQVSINSNLALKTSLQLLYDKLPALVQVPLTGSGVPSGTNVLTPLDKVDSVFTVALVINF